MFSVSIKFGSITTPCWSIVAGAQVKISTELSMTKPFCLPQSSEELQLLVKARTIEMEGWSTDNTSDTHLFQFPNEHGERYE